MRADQSVPDARKATGDDRLVSVGAFGSCRVHDQRQAWGCHRGQCQRLRRPPGADIRLVSRSRALCWRAVVSSSGTASTPSARRSSSITGPASIAWHCFGPPTPPPGGHSPPAPAAVPATAASPASRTRPPPPRCRDPAEPAPWPTRSTNTENAARSASAIPAPASTVRQPGRAKRHLDCDAA